jgi:Na+-transporting NADH:ubiquinone oxidoreductase subunit C
MSSDTLANETSADAGKPKFDRDSTANTIKVAVQLCLVCSIIVSLCAVVLRPMQEANRKAFEQENILKAAGLYEEGCDVETVFNEVTPRIIELDTGTYDDEKDVETFDTVKAARAGTPPQKDIARIKRREAFAKIYEVDSDKDGKPDQVVLPIRGYGLWSTLYGFIALDVSEIGDGLDKVKVNGLSYFKHGETPGLGGEVDNPNWKAKWPGKQVFDADGTVLIQVAKAPKGESEVDALSGATITSKGVTNMLQFWLGTEGYGPFLKNLQKQ